MNNEIRYLQYAPKYRNSLLQLFKEMFGFADLRQAEQKFVWRYEDNYCLQAHNVYIAVIGDKVVGFRGFAAQRFLFADKPRVVLTPSDAVVHPDFRRRGIFNKLTEYAMQVLSEKYDELDLSVYLMLLRELAPISTICMHGSPLSRYDNRDLWQDYSYREHGIIGEPYFDIDYTQVLYLTDTGRSWNNRDASIRDKVDTPFNYEIKSTFHLIELIQGNELPDKIMINTHPQRWNDGWQAWMKELVAQKLKNVVKRALTR